MAAWTRDPNCSPLQCHRQHRQVRFTNVYLCVCCNLGTSWVPVTGCEHVIDPLVCNLTDAFPDLRKVYLVQVTAWLDAQVSQAATYQGFIPIRDTHLDLPLLTVTACGRNLCVDLHPPVEHLRHAYDTLQYKLNVKSNSADGAQFFKDSKSLRRQILEDLAPGRQYCVSVCFSDSLESKESNYSQPVCAYTSGVFPADPLISALLCLLVLVGVVVFLLLIFTGFICLKRGPLPLVLTSVYHVDQVLVLVPCRMLLSSLLSVKAALPPSGEKRSNHSSSEESDGEVVLETTDKSRGGYTLRVGNNILSSSSSSSSSLSVPLPISFSSQTPNLLSAIQPELQVPKEMHSNVTHILSTDTSANEDINSLTAVQTGESGEEGNQDVNLLTLTFGRHEEETEAVNISLVQSSETWDNKNVVVEAVFCLTDEEEEEDEPSGYMGRPCTDILKNLL
ncbi:cytokine receptor family member b2 isoform X2 [Echeneis naucrates]|uniref:cytokine receptor family member b2 isoform X2 n=1 Tax=Echeneis naucrates TaxID=173247 RepID=UPI00111390B9|nr:uncharacterized protein LOC115061872 isoform X2 [Echeneis naucrates]